MTVHAFVDESKRRGFLSVAAIVQPRDLAMTRTTMRALCLRGQPRLHFQKERPARRAEIATVIANTTVRLDVYDATAINDQRVAGTACLNLLAANLTEEGAHRWSSGRTTHWSTRTERTSTPR